MASSDSSSHHPNVSGYYPVGPTVQPHEQPKRHGHLHLHIPAASCFTGCFRPSAGGGGGERPPPPPSPSLIRSPSAWIRAKAAGAHGHSSRHGRRLSADFRYDPRSYARNFDEGDAEGGEDEAEELAAGDALKYRCFSSRLPASPPSATCGKGKEATT